MNHDGIPDLLVSTNGGLVVLLGTGNGAFGPPAYYPGGSASGLAVGDFTGNGNSDAAMATGSTISIYRGNGDGTFQPPHSFPVCGAGYGQNIVTGDFNGDGKVDIAYATPNYCGPAPGLPYLQVILGHGDGTFQDASTCPPVAGGAQCIPLGNTYATEGDLVAADVNGDGKTDLVFTNWSCYIGGDFIGVLIGNGDGTFQGPTDNTGCYSRATLGDFNGDGKLDIGAPYSVGGGANIAWNILAALPGDGAGNFGPPIYTQTNEPSNLLMASGDFNGDHLSDVVAAGSGVPAAVGVYISNGDGTFQQPTATYPLPYGWLLSDLVAADLNGDGQPDVVAADFSYSPGGGIISVFINTTRPPGPAKVTLGPTTEVIRPGGQADLTAQVLTASGAPAPGVPVAFNVVSGPDSQSCCTYGTSDANGYARFVFDAFGRTGFDTVVATVTTGSTTLTSNSATVQVAASDPLQTIGLLTVTDPSNGARHSCTASVIASYNQSTIVTAAHCAYGNGNYFTDFAFAPSFSGDVNKCGSNPHACKEPFGVWTGERAYVDSRWISSGDHSVDFAFIIMRTAAGVPIERAIGGGLSVAFDSNPNQPWTAYGYPGSPTLRQCSTSAASLTSVGSGPDNFVISPCNLSGDPHGPDEGASGGPWLTLASPADQIGAVSSTSASCSSFALFCTKELRGAQLQSAAESLSYQAITDFGTFVP